MLLISSDARCCIFSYLWVQAAFGGSCASLAGLSCNQLVSLLGKECYGLWKFTLPRS